MIQLEIGYNIVDIANLLTFAYWSVVQKLKIFILFTIYIIKMSNYICLIKEQQETCFDMLVSRLLF